MDLHIKDQLFVVGGATSGFGRAIALQLLQEGAHIIAVARSADQLSDLAAIAPNRVSTVATDVTSPELSDKIIASIANRSLHGVLINAGGPPAKTFMETTLEDWDNAYNTLLRWKVSLTKALLPLLQQQQYGRVLYIESSSVKQPLENLVLSNSLRLAVVGFVKTLSQEIAASGVTLNIMAPGSHDTPAIQRVYNKKAEQAGISPAAAREKGIQQIPVGRLGKADDFASLAAWLLSPAAGYITGQTITVDGGTVKSIFG
ncbi:MAG TPA: SDR family oxidoreductase [Chitinophagaceae bacterium]|nr:SDR family oxidoreductase [Chitinophagaceae bacterium]